MLIHVFICDGCKQEARIEQKDKTFDPNDPNVPIYQAPPSLPLGWLRIAGELQGKHLSYPVPNLGFFCSVDCAGARLVENLNAASSQLEERDKNIEERIKYEVEQREYMRRATKALPGYLPDNFPAPPIPPAPQPSPKPPTKKRKHGPE